MELMTVGIVRGAHGLDGTLKVESTSGETAHFADLTEVTLRKDGVEKRVHIENVSGGAGNLLIKCAEIGTADDAKKYGGAHIVVPRSKACPLYEGEFYVEDLKQCRLLFYGQAAKAAPVEIGTVTGVLEGGGGDLLEVSLSESFDLSKYINFTDGEPKNSSSVRFIPFKSEFIGKVDIPRKVIELMHLWILE